jgi:uncharacterized membrane protein
MGEWIRGESSIEVAASPESCFEVLADMDAYPEWQDMVEAIGVRELDELGRPRVVETLATTPIRAVRYVMRYEWDRPRHVRWRQLSGDLDDLEGSYELVAGSGDADSTIVTYRLGILPSGRLAPLMRSPLFPKLSEWFMRQSLEELKRRCESRA